MKKFSWCLAGGILCSALCMTALHVSTVQAEPRSGEVLYQSCSSCHTPTKRTLAGKDAAYLLEKFAYYQSSPKFKAMKNLFDAMSDAEKAELAMYIQKMQ